MRPPISCGPTVRLKRLTATSPPKRLVTASTSSKLNAARGGPRHGPPHLSNEGGYAPLGLPRPTLGAPRETRDAPRSPACSSGPAHPAHDPLGQERDHQDQHEAVEHDVHARAPANGGAGELGH